MDGMEIRRKCEIEKLNIVKFIAFSGNIVKHVQMQANNV